MASTARNTHVPGRRSCGCATTCRILTPVGPLTVGVERNGAVASVRFEQTPAPWLSDAHPALAKALQRYFDANEDLSGVPVALKILSGFQREVLAALRCIPSGEVRTYAQVAASIGRPAASRAVGRACATNPVPIIIPCHRVVGSSGYGGYQAGVGAKLLLLQREGALVQPPAGRDRLSSRPYSAAEKSS